MIALLLTAMLADTEQLPACRVTGTVISVQAETKAAPADRQFRLEITQVEGIEDSNVQRRKVLPVTAKKALTFGVGATVAVTCQYKSAFRDGRFYGAVEVGR